MVERESEKLIDDRTLEELISLFSELTPYIVAQIEEAIPDIRSALKELQKKRIDSDIKLEIKVPREILEQFIDNYLEDNGFFKEDRDWDE